MVRKTKPGLLTEVELEFMVLLWELGEGSVRDLLANLDSSRKLAYTSAASIMRILENKRVVTSCKEGKTFVYRPLLQKSDYEARTIGHIVSKLFDDEPMSLVSRLIERHELSDKELQEIRKIIEQKVQTS